MYFYANISFCREKKIEYTKDVGRSPKGHTIQWANNIDKRIMFYKIGG